MCSASGLILFLIASLIFNLNYLHFNDKQLSQRNRNAFVAASAGASDDVGGLSVSDAVEAYDNADFYDVNNAIDDHDEVHDNDLHINIIRQHSLQLNGVEITSSNLFDHLEDHEREFIFGKSKEKRSVKLVHVRHAADDVDKRPSSVQQQQRQSTEQQQQHQRLKRSANRQSGAQASQEVAVHIRDSEQLLHLSLRQSPKLIDDAFVFIRRYENSTQFIEDSHKLAKKYANCFYSNANSALDLCDNENMHGLIHHNNTDFIIHPLPDRFGNATHVIFESKQKRPFARSLSEDDPVILLNENVQFEPDEADFNEPANNRTMWEETSRPTREVSDADSSSTDNAVHNQDKHVLHHQYHRLHHHHHEHQHHGQQKPNFEQLHLNLRYKPRYLHNDQQPERHQEQFTLKHQTYAHTHSHTKSKQRRRQKQLKQNHHPHTHMHAHPHEHHRQRRYIASGSEHRKIPQVLHIETAIFVDSDLFKHMAKNYPRSTESHLTRFVLAMINGVQLLYQHPSLGRRINFVLKRLEILYKDPRDLRRSSDIHTYLNNFCMWQQNLNPLSDADSVHYDHAVILTGLDLYGIDEYSKINSQVVGLAPVAGMCIPTSSCTVNEGKHFESVFVVAHEIGHNLGMRHDTNENGCDPSLYIMSKTLGSGKITWSKCSRTYLNTFLETSQAQCLFDRGQFNNNLDHSAEGMLPGERFDANQQCMLKYGKDSVRARTQTLSDICRDLHCQRISNSWTSHPALEGTECGENKWCRSGICVMRPSVAEVYSSAKQVSNYTTKPDYDKRSFLSSNKLAHLQQEYAYTNTPSWGEWGEASECESGCLYGPSKRLGEGSTGLKTYSRRCLDYRRRCLGRDRKFEACRAEKCYRVEIITIEKFASKPCEQAKKFDPELTGEGVQIEGDIEESCKVFCKTKSNGTKSRSWTFPDGTTCRSKHYKPEDVSYCIAGRCEKFSCYNSTTNYYKMDPRFCHSRRSEISANSSNSLSNAIPNTLDQRRMMNSAQKRYGIAEHDQQYDSNNNQRIGVIRSPAATAHSKYENEVAVRSYHGQTYADSFGYKRKLGSYNDWNKYNYRYNDQRPIAQQSQPRSASLIAIAPETEWIVNSGCHSSCMAKSKGLQVVKSRRTGENKIQLCTDTAKPCERLLTHAEYADNICGRFKLKVRGLSGRGRQIEPSIAEPDRSCRVGCQDASIKYRYYLLNGKYAQFPLGTKCSNKEDRYCYNGKCLEFGRDNISVEQLHISLTLFRNRRSLDYSMPVANASESSSLITKNNHNAGSSYTQNIFNSLENSNNGTELRNVEEDPYQIDAALLTDHIEFTNPINLNTDELNEMK